MGTGGERRRTNVRESYQGTSIIIAVAGGREHETRSWLTQLQLSEQYCPRLTRKFFFASTLVFFHAVALILGTFLGGGCSAGTTCTALIALASRVEHTTNSTDGAATSTPSLVHSRFGEDRSSPLAPRHSCRHYNSRCPQRPRCACPARGPPAAGGSLSTDSSNL